MAETSDETALRQRRVNKRKLSDLFATRVNLRRPELIWDAKQPGLALSVRPTGKKAWKVIYRHHGRPRWLHLGDVRSICLAEARRFAAASCSPSSKAKTLLRSVEPNA